MSTNGTVVDMAKEGPPEGEKGTASPSMVTWGTSVWGAYDEWNRPLGSPSEKQLKAMLDRDGNGEAMWNVLTLPLTSAPVEIKPHAEDAGEAAWTRDVLQKPPWEGGMSIPLEHVLAQVSGATVFRKAFFEKVWGVSEDRWVLEKLAFRPAESCTLTRDKRTGSFQGFKQRVPFDHPNADDEGHVSFGPEKAYVHVHDQAREPICGRSALETAYRAYEAKQKVRWLWFVFLERAAGRWAEAKDEGGDPQQSQALARKVAALKSGGVIGLGKDQSMTLHEPTSEGGAYRQAMDWLTVEQNQSVLAGFLNLTTSATGTGSYALSKDSSDFYLRACYARLKEVESSFTTYVIADLIRWNFPAGHTPRLKFGRLTEENFEAALGLLKDLVQQSQPNPQVPREALQLLFEEVASGLGVDVDRVKKMFEAQGEVTPDTVAQGAQGVMALMQEAGIQPPGVAATPVGAA